MKAKIKWILLVFVMLSGLLFPISALAATNQPDILSQGLLTAPTLPVNGYCTSTATNKFTSSFTSSSPLSKSNMKTAVGSLAGTTNNNNALSSALGGVVNDSVAQPLESAFQVPSCSDASASNKSHNVFLGSIMRINAPVVITDNKAAMEAIAIAQYIAFAAAIIFIMYFGVTYIAGIQMKTDPFKFGIRMFIAMLVTYLSPYLMQDILNLNNVLVDNLSKIQWTSSGGGGVLLSGAMILCFAGYQILVGLAASVVATGGASLILIGIIVITAIIYLIKPMITILIWWYMRLLKIFILAAIGPVFLVMMALPETASYSKKWMRAFIGETFSQSFMAFGIYLFALIFTNLSTIDKTMGIGIFGNMILIYAMFLTLEELPHLSNQFIGGISFGNSAISQATSGVMGAMAGAASAMQYAGANIAGAMRGRAEANKVLEKFGSGDKQTDKNDKQLQGMMAHARKTAHNQTFETYGKHGHKTGGVNVGWKNAKSVPDTFAKKIEKDAERMTPEQKAESNEALYRHNPTIEENNQGNETMAEEIANSTPDLIDNAQNALHNGGPSAMQESTYAQLIKGVEKQSGSVTALAKKNLSESENQTANQAFLDARQGVSTGEMSAKDAKRQAIENMANEKTQTIADPTLRQERKQALINELSKGENYDKISAAMETGVAAYAFANGIDMSSGNEDKIDRLNTSMSAVRNNENRTETETLRNTSLAFMEAMGIETGLGYTDGMLRYQALGEAYLGAQGYENSIEGITQFAKDQGMNEVQITNMKGNPQAMGAMIQAKTEPDRSVALNQIQAASFGMLDRGYQTEYISAASGYALSDPNQYSRDAGGFKTYMMDNNYSAETTTGIMDSDVGVNSAITAAIEHDSGNVDREATIQTVAQTGQREYNPGLSEAGIARVTEASTYYQQEVKPAVSEYLHQSPENKTNFSQIQIGNQSISEIASEKRQEMMQNIANEYNQMGTNTEYALQNEKTVDEMKQNIQQLTNNDTTNYGKQALQNENARIHAAIRKVAGYTGRAIVDQDRGVITKKQMMQRLKRGNHEDHHDS